MTIVRVAAGLLCGICIQQSITAAPPRPVAADPAKQLLLDERVIQSTRNVRLELGAVRKDAGNPVMKADRPWENALNNLYPNVAVDPGTGAMRLWYKCVVHDQDAIAKMLRPTTIHDQGWYLLYAESRDGKSWQRPLSARYPFDGRQTNAVCQDVANVGVMFDPQEEDSTRRYKMIYDVGHGKLRVRFSPDGIGWSEPIEAEGFGPYHGDTHNNAFWDERSGRYVLITRAYYGERLVARFESRDFIHWEQARIVLRSTLEEGKNTQLYCLPAFPYANGYIGYATMYHVGAGRTVDVELAYSEDSIHWRRILPGQPLIPRGATGTYDAGCVYPPAGPAIEQDGKLQLIYGGSQAIHKDWKRSCEPCLATLPLDGFAGYRPDTPDAAGEIVTQPLLVVAPQLRISARVNQGSVRVRVLSAHGIPGASSMPITTDAADRPVEFPASDPSPQAGQAVELKLELTGDAQVFSISGVELLPAPTAASAVERFVKSFPLTLQPPSLSKRAHDLLGTGIVRYTHENRLATNDDPAASAPLLLDRDVALRARTFYRDGQIVGAELTRQFRRVSEEWGVPPVPRTLVPELGGKQVGWKALDQLAANRDDQGQFLTARREPGYGVFLIGDLGKLGVGGNWRDEFDAEGIEISFRLRSPTPGSPARLEIAPPDLPGWHFQGLPEVTNEWTNVSTVIDLSWNDDEAQAAGWVRAAAGFSWQETMSHAGTLVIGTSAHPERAQIDVRDVRLNAMVRRD